MRSQEEFDAMLAGKRQAVEDWSDGVRAAEHVPQNFYSRRRHEQIVMGIVLDRERESPMAWRGSTDGTPSTSVSLPKSQVKVVHSDGRFVVMTMMAWVAADRRMVQANIPGLAKSIDWTDVERASWKIVQHRVRDVRRALEEENRAKRLRRAKGPTHRCRSTGYVSSGW